MSRVSEAIFKDTLSCFATGVTVKNAAASDNAILNGELLDIDERENLPLIYCRGRFDKLVFKDVKE